MTVEVKKNRSIIVLKLIKRRKVSLWVRLKCLKRIGRHWKLLTNSLILFRNKHLNKSNDNRKMGLKDIASVQRKMIIVMRVRLDYLILAVGFSVCFQTKKKIIITQFFLLLPWIVIKHNPKEDLIKLNETLSLLFYSIFRFHFILISIFNLNL